MTFEESLRLSIALGLTIFLVLLRFDSERIMRSDYFRYRYPWLGPVSYYGLVIAFAIGIVLILPNGRGHLFLTPGEPGVMLPLMLGFAAVGILNAVAFAFRWYGGITPLPTSLLPSRLLGAARQRGGRRAAVPLDRAGAADLRRHARRRDHRGRGPGAALRRSPSGACGASGSGTSSSAR